MDGQDVSEALRELRTEIARLRDDLFVTAVLTSPWLLAGGDASQLVRAAKLTSNGADPTAVATLYENNGTEPQLLYIRAITSDNTDFTLLVGAGNTNVLTAAQAPSLQFGRVVNTAVVVRPNAALSAAAISQTGDVLVTVARIPVIGRRIVSAASAVQDSR